MEQTRRPPDGFGHYLRDLVYGALDGAITTMAVVAGTAGAALSPRIGIILGLANLIADGLSMGASNYLGLKSELEQSGRSIAEEAPWRHGLATAAAFVVVGALPLLGYVIGPDRRPAGPARLRGVDRDRAVRGRRRAGAVREAPDLAKRRRDARRRRGRGRRRVRRRRPRQLVPRRLTALASLPPACYGRMATFITPSRWWLNRS